MTSNTWGIVSTIKAPTQEVLSFVAYHLEQGAHHIYVYLDDCNAQTAEFLQAHPKTTAILTDDAYWQELLGRRPGKHQLRQTRNATHCYQTLNDVDWLAHIDVDEFLCTQRDIAEILAEQPADTRSVRMEPFESLCDESETKNGPVFCKSKIPAGPDSSKVAMDIYPNFGGFFKSAFISHTAGKVFAKTGIPGASLRIHRLFDAEKTPIRDARSSEIELCHRHVQSWDKWLKIMQFRLTRGSYRAELEQSISPASGRISRHNLFTSLTDDGTDDLRSFFEEVCLATPKLKGKLAEHGLLRAYDLRLNENLSKHFPNFST